MSFFVTGTDTNVGKTWVSCGLLTAFAAQGRQVLGMKPVAAGCDPQGQNEDVMLLCQASNVSAPTELVNPYCFMPPVAPHLAAEQQSVSIDCQRLLAAYQQLSSLAEVVIVEGAGGFCVPINATEDLSHLAQRLHLPVILVVAMRLGCLNHALLTAEVIRARGLLLAGWVANVHDAAMPLLNENIVSLQQRLSAPLLGVVPPLLRFDAQQLAVTLDVTPLLPLLSPRVL